MWLGVRSDDGVELAGRQLDDGAVVVIGRDASCGLVLGDMRVSSRHARLTGLAGGWVSVEDLGSTNGTWVDGARISAPVIVGAGHDVRVGGYTIGLASAGGPAAQLVSGFLPPPPLLPPRPPAPPGPLLPPAPPAPAAYLPPPPLGPPAGAPPSGGFASSGAISPFGPPAPPSKRRRRWVLVGTTAVVLVPAVVVASILASGGGHSPPKPAQTFTPSQLFARWGPSTLYIQTDVGGKPLESGSGWVLNAREGLIVTNAHVVDSGPPSLRGLGTAPATTYKVGQGAKQQPAVLVGVSPCDDLAVLKIDRTAGLRSFIPGRQAEVQDGDAVTALGYPGAGTALPQLALTAGVVSNRQTAFTIASLETPDYPDLIETNAQINPGNSGGPLLNDRGQIIGINTASITEENNRIIQGEGFAIGIDRAKPVLKSLAVGQSKAFTGFNFVFPEAATDFSAFGLPTVPGGIIIPTADIGSPAYQAGFGHGRALVISGVNGKALNGTLSSYCNLVGNLTAGQSAMFSVVSAGGTTRHIKVSFG